MSFPASRDYLSAILASRHKRDSSSSESSSSYSESSDTETSDTESSDENTRLYENDFYKENNVEIYHLTKNTANATLLIEVIKDNPIPKKCRYSRPPFHDLHGFQMINAESTNQILQFSCLFETSV